MDELVIKQGKIIDERSPYHNQIVDILIKDGVVVQIGEDLNGENSLDAKGCIVSQGLTDLRSFVQDPGEEFKEDYESMEKAAMAGGFTTVCVHPHDAKALNKKQDIEYINSINKNAKIQFVPIAACTHALQGEEVTEMYDMKKSGARGFSNGNMPIPHSGVMNRVMQYVANTDTTLFIHAQLDNLVPNWQVAEGINNLKTGLKGLPTLAESILVQRDIALAEYNNTKVHFSHVSSSESVQMIKEAKKKGISVTADVSIMHLLFDDSDILDFDTNFKCNPPLRSKENQLSIIEGLKDGTIDAICTDHTAQDRESKIVEFDQSHFGATTIQWSFSKAYEKLKEGMELSKIINLFTHNPNQILGLNHHEINIGNKPNLIVFDPNKTWSFDSNTNLSKSINSPLWNKNIQGKIIGIYTLNSLTIY